MDMEVCTSRSGDVVVIVVSSERSGPLVDLRDFQRALRALPPLEIPREVLSSPADRLIPPGRRRPRPTVAEGRLRAWRVGVRGR